MGANVTMEVAELGEGLGALRTAVRLLTGVCPYVRPQVVALGEGLVAVAAREGTLA